MATIFISYKRGTNSIFPLMERLRKAKYRIWFDRNDIHLGDPDWQAQIDRGLSQCDAVILGLTTAACKSEPIKYEVKKALQLEKPIFPLILEPLESISDGLIEVGLSSRQHVEDFSATADWDIRCSKLLADLAYQGIRVTRHDVRKTRGEKSYLLHQRYLSKVVERVGRVNFSITPNDDISGNFLENVYIDLPTDLALDVQIQNYTIVDWWLGEEGQYLNSRTHRNLSEIPVSARTRPKNKGWESAALEVMVGNRQEYYENLQKEKEEKEEIGEFFRDIEDGVYLADIRLNITDVISSHDRLVILGHPGSGKSTSVKYLALCLAVNQISGNPRNVDLSHMGNWTHGELTPIYIELRHFIASNHFPQNLEDQPTSNHLWSYICSELLGEDLQDYEEELHSDLLDGNAVIIFDGLDEIPYPRGKGKLELRQKQMKSLAFSIQDVYPKCRFVVTSRPYAYKGWKLPSFSDVVLSSFEKSHRIELATKLYSEICETYDEATDKAQRLDKALKSVDRELKDNPLFLTLMATLFQQGEKEGLPTKAGILYYQSIILLLERWTSKKGNQVALTDLLGGLSRDDLISRLAALAFDVHKQLGENPGTPEIPKGLLYEHIFSLEREDAAVNASALLSYLSENAGVLVSPGQKQGQDVFHFAHRTFQEYLTARHVIALCLENRSFTLVKELIEERPQLWRLPCLLIDDVLVQMDREDDLWYLFEDLLPEDPPDQLDPSDPRCFSAWLACQNAVDQDRHLEMRLRRSVETTKTNLLHWLQKIIETPDCMTIQERVEVGDALGLFGDKRKGVGLRDGIPDIEWCHVPLGRFLMGTDRTSDLLAQEDEPDIFPLEIEEFYISKYPITYAQYEAFVEDDGYSNRLYWTKAGWEWKGNKIRPETHWNKEGWHISNHPVIGLTWFEAYAFTQWLTQKLGYKVRLPTEAEIQKSARGTNGQVFSYGNIFDLTKGNTSETGIGRTSTVGLFLGDLSPYGAHDMSGNAFDWCLSQWTNPYQHHTAEDVDVEAVVQRVRTGGSCQRDASLARAAFRIGFDQDYRSYSSGFRVACKQPRDL